MVNRKSRIIISGSVLLLAISLADYVGYALGGTRELDNKINSQLQVIKRFSFCDESIPFDKKKNLNRFKFELRHVAKEGIDSDILIRKSQIILPAIEPILKQQGVPDDIKYLAVAESALSSKYTSTQGAAGLWQIIKPTGLELGLEINEEVDERLHFTKSTIAACELLKKNKNFFGSWTAAAIAYNMGPVALYKAMKYQQAKTVHDLALNKETSGYVFRSLAYKEFIENCEYYGVSKSAVGKRQSFFKLRVNKSISDLRTFAAQEKIDYHLLKEYNPWILTNKLTIKHGRAYELLIPYSAGTRK